MLVGSDQSSAAIEEAKQLLFARGFTASLNGVPRWSMASILADAGQVIDDGAWSQSPGQWNASSGKLLVHRWRRQSAIAHGRFQLLHQLTIFTKVEEPEAGYIMTTDIYNLSIDFWSAANLALQASDLYTRRATVR